LNLMSILEYFHVFKSIFYGLIVAQLLLGWNRMISYHGKYEFYWAHFGATLVIFLAVVQTYYAESATLHPPQNIIDFLFTFIFIPASLFIAAYQMFPQKMEGIKMLDFVISHRWKIVGPLIAFESLTVLDVIINYGTIEWYQWVPHTILTSFLILFGVIPKKIYLEIAVCYALFFTLSFYAIRFSV